MFNLTAFIGYMVAVTFTPGPNNILVMTNAGTYGFKRTLNYMAGGAIGVFLIVAASTYFNVLLFDAIPTVKPLMGIAGAAYMIYLALRIIRSKPPEAGESGEPLRFHYGFIMQFLNPKLLIFAVTATSNFIVPYFESSYYLPFTILMTMIFILSWLVWSLCGSVFKLFLNRHYKPFNIAMGLILIYSAVSISGLV
ncbi:MAG: lysine transporter LysE [Clostridiales bacterium]|nr:MAG: lysine transporter LysE [Clostridiales bacterium]